MIVPNSSFALSYKDDMTIEVRKEQNTERNIEQAKLLLSYIRDYKKSISDLEEKYGITYSFVLTAYKKELDSMTRALKRTETLYIEKSDAESIRLSVISGLKDLSILVKENLKKEQIRYENKMKSSRNFYAQVGNQIRDVISRLTRELTTKLSQKSFLTVAEKEIVRSLVRLSETSDAIQEFGRREFDTQEQMKVYYIEIVRSIRKEVSLITRLVNSD